ncbi:MAG: hypothetical protein H6502_04675 [Candidatus Woesearchaeota archaeon]|nr:MAG: hypothetical protein H6502_04675 [Candidatus Woesearchaeota archaeon]
MVKKKAPLVIELNNSEALAFSGCFGLLFALPNIYQIFLNQIFPIIIETSTNYTGLFKFLYAIAIILLTYETYHWIIQLVKIMRKTYRIHKNYRLYVFKLVIFGMLGFAVAILLNKWFF